MMKQYLALVVLCIIVLFTSVHFTAAQDACSNQSNKDCGTCLGTSSCAYCKTSKACFVYNQNNLLSAPCAIADMQVETCVGSFQAWIIVVAVIGGIVLIAIVIAIICVCRKCKHASIRREERRQAGRQQVDDQRMEERRAAAEVRATERNRVADQIRMKYGILKEKENGTDYTRMT